MAAYTYKALSREGKVLQGLLEADSERQARSQLRARQLKPIEVFFSGEDDVPAKVVSRLLAPRLGAADLALLTRQMATLVEAGVPVAEALAACAAQAGKNKVKSLLMQVRSKVVEGHSLGRALAQFPWCFTEMYRAMVNAGEQAGKLGHVLEQMASYIEQRHHARQKIKMALVYPAALMLVSIVVIALLMVFVVPELTALFAHAGADLPALTRSLIAASGFLSAYWWGLLLIFGILLYLWRQLLMNQKVRILWHGFQLNIPLLSRLLLAMDCARFASTLSILVSSGVPLLDGLRIAAEVMNNLRLRGAAAEVALRVEEGSSLHKALEGTGVFPPMMVQMVASGEQSGSLGVMLNRSALSQERELDMNLAALGSLFEPLLLVVMAAVVGGIVMAILLPIMQMNALVS